METYHRLNNTSLITLKIIIKQGLDEKSQSEKWILNLLDNLISKIAQIYNIIYLISDIYISRVILVLELEIKRLAKWKTFIRSESIELVPKKISI